jgi:hypothetical protein
MAALIGCAPGAGSDATADSGASATDPKVPGPEDGAKEERPTPEPVAPAKPDEEATIAAGSVRLGTTPGLAGRDPRTEADLVEVQVPAFHIDRLPYPNDPAEPVRTGVTRPEAAQLCAQEGKRLCTEVEWERACKGSSPRAFPGGRTFDVETCALEPSQCASPLGVLGLGVLSAEWTSSDAGPAVARGTREAVRKGAGPMDPAAAHRCGARHLADPARSDDEAGFRCCRDAAPGADPPAYPEPSAQRSFASVDLDDEAVQRILASIPELARFADDFQPIGDLGRARAVGSATLPETAPNGWAIAEPILRWSPVRGEDAWVLAGYTGKDTVIAVIHPTGRDTYVHGASFVLQGERTSIAILYTPDRRELLQWTACFACQGEGGTIERREDGRIAILHH